MKKLLLVFLGFVFSLSYAQDHSTTTTPITTGTTTTQTNNSYGYQSKKPAEKDPFKTRGTIKEQFEYIDHKSNYMGDHRLVKIDLLNALEQSMKDSIRSMKKDAILKDKIIQSNDIKVQNIVSELQIAKQQLEGTQGSCDSRSLFGLEVNKDFFSILLAVSYGFLIIVLSFFAFKYYSNKDSSEKALEDLRILQEEYDQYKKNSLIKIQEVSRRLQDELNKKWKGEK